MDDLAQSWKKLSLFEEEGRKVDLSRNKKVGSLVLAAKFLTRKAVNIEAVAQTFHPIWRTRSQFDVSDVGNNVVLMEFKMEVDTDKVLMGEPWSFDRHLVVFERYDGSVPIQELKFCTTSFWVQIHDLPYSYLNIETALSLGDSLGMVMKPKDTSEMVEGSFMRVRVVVDITKPLYRDRRVMWDQSSEGWISFKYERLPNICYRCGQLSHDDKDCILWIQSKGSLLKEDQQFGPWIRANQYNPVKKVTIKVEGFDTPELGSRSRNIVSPSPSMLKMLVTKKNHSQSIATVASRMEFKALDSGTVLILALAATANIFSN